MLLAQCLMSEVQFRRAILKVPFYGWKTWPSMVREEKCLGMSVNKTMRGIFRPKTEVVVGRGILYNREFQNFYSWNKEAKQGRRGGRWIYVTLELVHMSPIIFLVFHSNGFGFHLHLLNKRVYRKEKLLSTNMCQYTSSTSTYYLIKVF